MENQLTPNRVEKELSLWISKEESLGKLFSASPSFSSALLREKLQYYDGISARYGNSNNPDERLALRVMKLQRNAIEKQLYPSLLFRLLRRIFISPVRKQLMVRNNNRQAIFNSQSLHDTMQRIGFSNLNQKLDEQIKLGQEKFSIPFSYYINDKERLEHQLSFSKDQAGNYFLEGYQSSLYNELKPEENRQHYFNLKSGFEINTMQSHNLLAGRSVSVKENWIQFNFNDKDAEGSYRIKEFLPDFGYDLKEVLKQLPIKQPEDSTQADKLRNSLLQGNRESVTFLKDGKEQRYYIEANPQFKSVTVYDEHSRKITLATATGNKTAASLKVVHKENEKKETNQAKRNGMRII